MKRILLNEETEILNTEPLNTEPLNTEPLNIEHRTPNTEHRFFGAYETVAQYSIKDYFGIRNSAFNGSMFNGSVFGVRCSTVQRFYFTLNRYTVVVEYVWPGSSSVLGKSGRLGESG